MKTRRRKNPSLLPENILKLKMGGPEDIAFLWMLYL